MLSKNTDSFRAADESFWPFPPNLFLVNPANKSALTGVRRPHLTFDQPTVTLLLGLAVFLASLAFFVKGAADLLTTARLINTGVTVQGEIINYRPATYGSTLRGVLYPVTYRFFPLDSRLTLSKVELVRKDILDRLSDGAMVDVKYLATDPQVSMLVGVDAERTFEGAAFVALTIGALGLLLVGVYWLAPVKHVLRDLRLSRSGWVLPGQLLYCRRYAPALAMRRDVPEEYDRSLSQHFVVEVSYRFETPEGKEARGWTRQRRDDLRGVRLPTFGTPVAVLYLNPKEHKIL